MATTKINRLLTKGKSIFLAMDQGLEHGPKDFNIDTINSENIIDIAIKGKYNGIILQKGIAEKYFENYKQKIPLIIKLNGKTNILKGEPYSAQNCSVKRAISLGAAAVGYTIYLGSSHEAVMFKEFGAIEEEAHDYGIPVIAWMYPRGSSIQDELNTDILAYAARVGLELGADFIKMKYNNDFEGYKWIIKCAGRARVLVAGGEKTTPENFLKEAYDVIKAGAAGMAVGRNVWQSEDPIGVTNALKSIIFEEKTPEEAIKYLNNGNKRFDKQD